MNNKILVVDDVAGVRRELCLLLQDEGYTAYQAESGKEALRILEDENIELVITDILMPDMDGLELCANIRKDFPGTKVIIISGGGRSYSKTSEGVDDLLYQAKKLTRAEVILKKPFKSDVLLEHVQSLLTDGANKIIPFPQK